MKSTATHITTETEVKRSKFLAHLVPIADFEEIRRHLREEHPKANHIVWALRRLNEHGQIVEESSDDGEPKGCAGKPVLHVMRGNGLIESAILVVRYFGGIKLGTGGMARAYGEAAKSVIGIADLLHHEKRVSVAFHIDYSEMGRWEYAIGSIGGLETVRDFDGTGALWKVVGDESAVSKLITMLDAARIVWERIDVS